jgi:hypothetical protein
LSFDLDVPIERLPGSCEEHSEADAIPEAPSKLPSSRFRQGKSKILGHVPCGGEMLI